MGSGDTSVLTATGGNNNTGGVTSTSKATGGAPADAAVGGTRPDVGVSNTSNGCAYGVAPSGDGRLPNLVVLLVMALAPLFRTRRR